MRVSDSVSYVQYGCGLCAPPGWVHFDISPTLRLQRLPIIGAVFAARGSVKFTTNVRYGDIVRGLQLPSPVPEPWSIVPTLWRTCRWRTCVWP